MRTSDIVKTALGAACIAVLAPVGFDIGTIPISLATLAVYIVACTLGKYRAAVATLIYIAIGAVGLPVFSGFSGGVGRLVGPTGGFLMGYIPMAFVIGVLVDLAKDKVWMYPVSMVVGTLLCYGFGCGWYMIYSGCTFVAALTVCVVPFIIVDSVKIALASFLGFNVRKTVDRL